MIELVEVCKSYAGGKVRAVDGLNLSVAKGELFGFLGPNGAGKTTTIKMLVGLLKPDSGSITVGGIDRISDPLAVKRIIGYVPDESVAYEKMTGAFFLGFNKPQLEMIVRFVSTGIPDMLEGEHYLESPQATRKYYEDLDPDPAPKRFCVFKPMGVLHAVFGRRCFMLVGNSSKRSDPLEDSIQGSSESNSQPKSLILAQNERWRQA